MDSTSNMLPIGMRNRKQNLMNQKDTTSTDDTQLNTIKNDHRVAVCSLDADIKRLEAEMSASDTISDSDYSDTDDNEDARQTEIGDDGIVKVKGKKGEIVALKSSLDGKNILLLESCTYQICYFTDTFP